METFTLRNFNIVRHDFIFILSFRDKLKPGYSKEAQLHSNVFKVIRGNIIGSFISEVGKNNNTSPLLPVYYRGGDKIFFATQ